MMEEGDELIFRIPDDSVAVCFAYLETIVICMQVLAYLPHLGVLSHFTIGVLAHHPYKESLLTL